MDGDIGVAFFVGKKPVRDRPIGHFNLDLIEVVRNRRIRDTWALQDTQKGEIELVLEWTPVELNAPPDPSGPLQMMMSTGTTCHLLTSSPSPLSLPL